LHAFTSIRKGSVFLGPRELPLSDNYKEAFMAAIGQGRTVIEGLKDFHEINK